MQQANNPGTLTVILAIWAAVGPLVGIFIGNHLVRSFQRRQWLADERIKEWRELLTVLTASLATITKCNTLPQTIEVLQEGINAHVAAGAVISNRLLIGQEVRRRKIQEKWLEATVTFEKDHDATAFGSRFGDVTFLIEDSARNDIKNV
jgi:hypothetical protein